MQILWDVLPFQKRQVALTPLSWSINWFLAAKVAWHWCKAIMENPKVDRAKGTDRRKHTHLLKETPLQHLSMICPARELRLKRNKCLISNYLVLQTSCPGWTSLVKLDWNQESSAFNSSTNSCRLRDSWQVRNKYVSKRKRTISFMGNRQTTEIWPWQIGNSVKLLRSTRRGRALNCAGETELGSSVSLGSSASKPCRTGVAFGSWSKVGATSAKQTQASQMRDETFWKLHRQRAQQVSCIYPTCRTNSILNLKYWGKKANNFQRIKGPDNPTSQLLPIMSNKCCSGDGAGRKDKGSGGGARSKTSCMRCNRLYSNIRTQVCHTGMSQALQVPKVTKNLSMTIEMKRRTLHQPML